MRLGYLEHSNFRPSPPSLIFAVSIISRHLNLLITIHLNLKHPTH
jgi:hypothetical protein